MPYKEPKIEKHFYKISEVAGLFGLETSTIRYWEEEFPSIKPYRNKKGNRLFTKEDIEQVRLVYHLLKEKGMTLKGAQKKLRENKEDTVNNFEIVKRLENVRSQLIDIRNELGEE
ncbi:MAG: MerR family transcriptional regulator [Chlorobi bacterium]|uniref:Transcriptional regulator, MerR family n=1 Tax=hydrothermal vent metagenome TaxID=652676 RepID=A0A3B0THX9_9ZZZZ|nr:MerR family transcriptional regulator [Chlorobiota bacterium]